MTISKLSIRWWGCFAALPQTTPTTQPNPAKHNVILSEAKNLKILIGQQY